MEIHWQQREIVETLFKEIRHRALLYADTPTSKIMLIWEPAFALGSSM
jgi:hypothetical protein